MKRRSVQIYRFTSLLIPVLVFAGNHVHAADKDCSDITGKVARAIVTTAVENREPIDRVLIMENKVAQLYFFSDLRHMQGQQITHRWEHEGKVVMRKNFEIKGPRWRIFSSMNLSPNMTGQWTVMITDKNDCPLKAVVFQYVEQDPAGQGSAIIDLKNN